MMGESLENVASGIDCVSIRQPLGVVAGEGANRLLEPQHGCNRHSGPLCCEGGAW